MNAPRPPPRVGADGTGLDALIERLQQRGLRIGSAEALDAAQLVLLLGRAGSHGDEATTMPPAPSPRVERLRHKLRAVLCKRRADSALFDACFDEWAARFAPTPLEPTAPATPAEPGAQTLELDATTPRRRRWVFVAAALITLAAVLLLYRSGDQPSAPSTPSASPTVPTDLPAAASAPASAIAAAASAAARNALTNYGYFPQWRRNTEIRPVWVWIAMALPLAAALPWWLSWRPLPGVSRRRGGATLRLSPWPPGRLQQRLVRPLPPAAMGPLQRHVIGSVDDPRAYARRPLFDARRTVQATITARGLPQPRYRFARLRPSYRVLVVAARDDDAAWLWAERLRQLDAHVELFRVPPRAWAGGVPVALEIGGEGRRFTLDAMPTGPAGQRLVLVAPIGWLFDAPALPDAAAGETAASPSGAAAPDGTRLLPWALAARFERWRERVLFTPEEPRFWSAARVAGLERRNGGDPGLAVFPLDDHALDAWAAWLRTGRLPESLVLAQPLVYPASLARAEAEFLAEHDPAAQGEAAARTAARVRRLIDELRAYLGSNGFYWLAAMAIPPLVDRRLALLLGEQYFLRCGASDERVSHFMALNWARLVRLPWLREDPPRALPQWLRLSLLAHLPPTIQDELREVVVGTLAARAPAGAAPAAAGTHADHDDTIELAFEGHQRARGEAKAPRADRDALYVGFVHQGLDAAALCLRLPGAWRDWLPRTLPAPPWRTRLAASWARLVNRQGVPGLGSSLAARRLALAAGGLTLLLVGALARVDPAGLPPALRDAVFVDRAYAVEMAAGRASAFSPDGTVLALARAGDGARGVTLWRSADGTALGELAPGSAVRGLAWSANGRWLAITGATGVQLWSTETRQPLGPPWQSGRSWHDLAFSNDSTRLRLAGGNEVLTLALPAGNLLDRFSLDRPESGSALPALAGDGRYVLRISGAAVQGFNVETKQPLGPLLTHPARVVGARLSPDGRRIASLTADGMLRVWAVAAGTLQAERGGSPAGRVAWTPDGRRLVTSGRGQPGQLWDAADLEPFGGAITVEAGGLAADTGGASRAGAGAPAQEDPGAAAEIVRFSRNGGWAVALDGQRARLWSATPPPAMAALAQPDAVRWLSFSGDGERLFTTSLDGTARAWRLDGQRLGTLADARGPIRAAALAPDGLGPVLVQQDGTVASWGTDLRPRAAPPALAGGTASEMARLTAFAFLSPSLAALAWDNRTLTLWDNAGSTALPAPTRSLWSGGEAAVTIVIASADRRALLAANGREARVWMPANQAAPSFGERPSFEPLRHAHGLTAAALAPDASLAATASERGEIRLWALQPAAGSQSWTGAPGPIRALAFSPDGRFLASGGDRAVSIWRLADRQRVAVPLQSNGEITTLAWSPRGGRLLVGTDDGRAMIDDSRTAPAQAQIAHSARAPAAAQATTTTPTMASAASAAAGPNAASARAPGSTAYLLHAPPGEGILAATAAEATRARLPIDAQAATPWVGPAALALLLGLLLLGPRQGLRPGSRAGSASAAPDAAAP